VTPRGSPAPRVIAIVPAHNEEERIAATVKSLGTVEAVGEVVVFADGTTDRTAEEASAAGARVLVAPRRLGKGAALDAALDLFPAMDVYLFIDADVSDTAGEAGKLLGPVLAGDLDVAVGTLPRQPGGGFGMVKGMARWLIHARTGFRAQEPLSGQRAITREAAGACRPLAAGFGTEVAMTIDLVRLGFRFGEVPVRMTHRPTGRGPGGFLHRGRQGFDILRAAVPRLLGAR
jgi:glycosyl transferase family 2